MLEKKTFPEKQTNHHVKMTHGIGYHLLAWILLFSSLITLLSTALQLYFDYRRDVGLIEERMVQIEESYLESLIDSLWVFNKRQILVQLEGIRRLPDMHYLEIRLKDGEVIASVGVKQQRKIISHEYSMHYFYKKRNRYLGTLQVVASLEGIYQRLLERALLILIAQGIKTFLVSSFILFIFHYLVTRHLVVLADQAKNFDIRKINKPFILHREDGGGKKDELDEVLLAMNIMQNNLKSSYKQLEFVNQQLQDDIYERKIVEQKLRESEENLESKVIHRTRELHDALQKLGLQHKTLQEAQSQLIQSEKMAALGTLVAGVAHEINNPVNFMDGSVRNLLLNLNSFQTLIYELAEDEADEEILDYFKTSFDRFFSNLNDIKEGSLRIKMIVNDLRTFSRLDEAERKEGCVVEGLSSTLRLIKAKYNKQIDFVCDFKTDPIIDGWHAQLNQVFMNIMVNACQAIRSRQKEESGDLPGKLVIRTFVENSFLGISFQDNGKGILPQAKDKIFEPFFSTKPVGEGTGLGLSISFGIIEKHRGKILVDSTVGQGTMFKVLIPLCLPGAAKIREV